jgi:activating signal cointegrator complex subunit 3
LQVQDRGLFFYGPEYRLVPLQQQFIGVNVNSKDRSIEEQKMNDICFEVVLDSLQRGYQVMVFVHSRKGTSDTCRAMADAANEARITHVRLKHVETANNGHKR